MARGDHIKVARWQGIYYHHGLDCGGGEVIHYTGEVASWRYACVQRDSLEVFLAGGGLEICDDYDKKFSVEESVERAESRMGEKAYALLGNNCEHFVRWCTTGEKLSQQVESAKQTLVEILKEGVSRGTQEVLVTFLDSDKLSFLKDLQAGNLERVGGMLLGRDNQSGGFVHIMRDGMLGGDSIPGSSVLQQCLQMSSVAGAASLINLGVSAVGFAFLAYQMNQLQKAMASVDQKIEEGFDKIDACFDSIDVRLEELKWFAIGNQNTAREILLEVRTLREELFERDRGKLLAALEMSRLDPASSITYLQTFKEINYSLRDGLLRGTPQKDTHSLVQVGGRFRVWSVAVASEGQSLLQLKKPQEAKMAFEQAGEHAHACASKWLYELLDGKPWGMFAHSRFEGTVLEDRLRRVAQIAAGGHMPLATFVLEKGRGAVDTDGYVKRLTEEEYHQYVGLLALVDLAIEVGNRFLSKAKECELCQQHNWSIDQYIQLGRDAEMPMILSFPVSSTNTKKANKWD